MRDRGAGTVEILQALADRRRRFLVRSCHDRAVGGGLSDAKAPAEPHAALREVPSTAFWPLDRRAKAVGAGGRGVAGDGRAAAPRARGESRREAVPVTAARV